MLTYFTMMSARLLILLSVLSFATYANPILSPYSYQSQTFQRDFGASPSNNTLGNSRTGYPKDWVTRFNSKRRPNTPFVACPKIEVLEALLYVTSWNWVNAIPGRAYSGGTYVDPEGSEARV